MMLGGGGVGGGLAPGGSVRDAFGPRAEIAAVGFEVGQVNQRIEAWPC